jgi:predicted nucleic acid-binding Zn ribbon protein
LERIFTTVDQTLFQHIDPIASPARKLEAIRVYELAKGLRKIAEFFFEQKGLFFSLRDLGHFVIPFTINFNKRVAGIINHDGRICFHASQNIFFNGLKIQKIHQCAVCQKFLLIASGKDNVDRTCSKSCRKILKNQKQNEKYASNLILVSENRKYRKIQKRRENGEFRFDEYTEKSFLTKLNGDNGATALYVAWTETFAALNGEVRRKDREKLHTISTKYEKVILDHGVLEGYRPRLINTRAKCKTDLCSPTEIIFPELVLIYFIRLSRNIKLKKLEQFWRRAGYLDLKRQYNKTEANLENEKLIVDRFLDLVEKVEGKIENNGFMLPLKRSREHNSYLARCDVLATAIIEKLPVVTRDGRFYKGLLTDETDVQIINASEFFGCDPQVDLDLIVTDREKYKTGRH